MTLKIQMFHSALVVLLVFLDSSGSAWWVISEVPDAYPFTRQASEFSGVSVWPTTLPQVKNQGETANQCKARPENL